MTANQYIALWFFGVGITGSLLAISWTIKLWWTDDYISIWEVILFLFLSIASLTFFAGPVILAIVN